MSKYLTKVNQGFEDDEQIERHLISVHKIHPSMNPGSQHAQAHNVGRQGHPDTSGHSHTVEEGVKKGTNDARHVEHPGFKRVQSHIADQEDPRHPGQKIGEERAGAILAARSRAAGAAAKRRNPNLKKVDQ